MTPELAEVLDRIEEYLDNLSDCEGNSAADWKPNEEMRLLNDLQAAREIKSDLLEACIKAAGIIEAASDEQEAYFLWKAINKAEGR